MSEEEKEEIELDIEAKYVGKTEKEFLSRVTCAECLYILTPENEYCDKIKELSLLKICEIIDKLKEEFKTVDHECFRLDEKEIKLKDKINKLKDEMQKDKMEQFDDYVVYLIEKYLKILEE